ncbi:MAG TPA: hypothetical protein VIC07_03070 [Acidimicrobiia bacterium]|jgi:hypothetical protein
MLTETRSDVSSAPVAHRFDLWWLVAVGSVLLSVVFASIFSPDMVTGSMQEHLPMAGMLDWFWGLVAIGYLAFARNARVDAAFGISVAILWLAVALTSIAAPEMVTGSDPTRIPLAVLIAPIVGCLATGFITLSALRRRD